VNSRYAPSHPVQLLKCQSVCPSDSPLAAGVQATCPPPANTESVVKLHKKSPA